MRRKKRWTDAEIEKLRSMVGKHSQDQIAQELGRPRGSVATKTSELNLSLAFHRRRQVHGPFALFKVGDHRLDPLLRKRIEPLLQKLPIMGNLLLKVVALIAHGSPLWIRREHKGLSVIDGCRGSGDDDS